MKNPATSQRLAGVLWVGTALVIGLTAWGHLRPVPAPVSVAQAGDSLSLSDLQATFDLPPATEADRWLMALGTGCPTSLQLARDLSRIKPAADCEGADLVPLVIVDGPEPDSHSTSLRMGASRLPEWLT